MKKNFSIFFLVFFTFIMIFPLYISQGNDILDYFGGQLFSPQDETNGEETNDCSCDIILNECQEFCCCDKDCHNDAIKVWRDRHKCIDEEDTIGIFSDRCIDKNLIVFSNSRRGLKKETQTEDVPNRDATIINYCYSMDNSLKMKKNIKYSDAYKETQSISIDSSEDHHDDNYLDIEDDNNNFNLGEHFSLFSGPTCKHSKKVKMLVPEKYSCLMNREKIIKKNNLNNNIRIKNHICTLNQIFYLDNGIILQEDLGLDYYISEVEFVIQMEENSFSNINNCMINIVVMESESPTNNNYLFKNSVVFKYNNENQSPYTYSGNGGYLNNYPLKIYFEDKDSNNYVVFNEFYIVGRDKNGNCRNDSNYTNFLYNYDEPINFKQDYSYYCNNNEHQELGKTTLYKSLSKIKKIGKYGSSSYKSINNDDWINVTFPGESEIGDNKAIIMYIFVGTQETGIYSHKYIYDVKIDLKKIESENKYYFKIKYYDLEEDEDNEKTYYKSPEVPLFLPNIPEDLIDPLIHSEVGK